MSGRDVERDLLQSDRGRFRLGLLGGALALAGLLTGGAGLIPRMLLRSRRLWGSRRSVCLTRGDGVIVVGQEFLQGVRRTRLLGAHAEIGRPGWGVRVVRVADLVIPRVRLSPVGPAPCRGLAVLEDVLREETLQERPI